MAKTTKKSYAESIEEHAAEIREAVEAGLREMVGEREALVEKIAEDLRRKLQKHEAAEKALHAAQNKVAELKRGRERNMAAVNSATLDDNEAAIQEAKQREKQRKKNLAMAERELEKVQAEFAAAKVDPGAEAVGARRVKVEADRGLERVLRDLEGAVSKAVQDVNIPEGQRGDYGLMSISPKVGKGEKSAGWDDERMRWKPSPEAARRDEVAASLREKYLG